MIIVTNISSSPVRSAAMDFETGERKFKDGELSDGKLAQIQAHPSLKWVSVENRPTSEKAEKKA